MTRRNRILLDVFLVYLATIGTIKLLYDLRFVSVIQQYLWTAAMLLQVYVPAWLLHRRMQPLSLTGLHLKSWQESIRWWLLMCLLFLPPSILGHHLWQSYNHHTIQSSGAPHLQFPTWLKGEPPLPKSSDEVQIYTTARYPTLTIRWHSALSGTLSSQGEIRVVSGAQWVIGPQIGTKIRFSGGGRRLFLRVQTDGTQIKFQFTRDGQPLPIQHLKGGAQRTQFTRNSLSRDLSWLFHLVLIQLFMVALPEEFFYRGYLQTRLDALWPPRLFFGIPLSLGNLLTSTLFALTHFLIGYQPYRLGVFFPSLLFGMLRHKTGSLLAPILFHATANILMKILEVWYL